MYIESTLANINRAFKEKFKTFFTGKCGSVFVE